MSFNRYYNAIRKQAADPSTYGPRRSLVPQATQTGVEPGPFFKRLAGSGRRALSRAVAKTREYAPRVAAAAAKGSRTVADEAQWLNDNYQDVLRGYADLLRPLYGDIRGLAQKHLPGMNQDLHSFATNVGRFKGRLHNLKDNVSTTLNKINDSIDPALDKFFGGVLNSHDAGYSETRRLPEKKTYKGGNMTKHESFVKRATDAQVHDLARLMKRAGWLDLVGGKVKGYLGKAKDKLSELNDAYQTYANENQWVRPATYGAGAGLLALIASLPFKMSGLGRLGLVGASAAAGVGGGLYHNSAIKKMLQLRFNNSPLGITVNRPTSQQVSQSETGSALLPQNMRDNGITRNSDGSLNVPVEEYDFSLNLAALNDELAEVQKYKLLAQAAGLQIPGWLQNKEKQLMSAFEGLYPGGKKGIAADTDKLTRNLKGDFGTPAFLKPPRFGATR